MISTKIPEDLADLRQILESVEAPFASKSFQFLPPAGSLIATQEVFQMEGCRVIASVLIPPLGVFLQVGLGFHFWLNILLTLLGYIPGLVHAIWIIAKED